MTFTLYISTDSNRKDIKEKCCEVLAEFLKKEGYFSVEFDPKEIDTEISGDANMWYEHHPYKMEIVGSTPTATTLF